VQVAGGYDLRPNAAQYDPTRVRLRCASLGPRWLIPISGSPNWVRAQRLRRLRVMADRLTVSVTFDPSIGYNKATKPEARLQAPHRPARTTIMRAVLVGARTRPNRPAGGPFQQSASHRRFASPSYCAAASRPGSACAHASSSNSGSTMIMGGEREIGARASPTYEPRLRTCSVRSQSRATAARNSLLGILLITGSRCRL
jgi:hypothetical protein